MLRMCHLIWLGIGIGLAPVRVSHGVEPAEMLEQLIAQREALEKREVAFKAAGSWKRSYPDGKEFASVDTLSVLAYGSGSFNLSMSSATPFPLKSGVLRRIVVSDGDAIVSTEFGPFFRPSGCQTEVRDYSQDSMVIATGGLTISPVAVHFASSPSRRHAEDAESVAVRETHVGTLELVLRFPKEQKNITNEVIFEIDPRLGHNVVSQSSRMDGYETPLARRTLEWQDVGGEWFVTRFIYEQYNRDGSVHNMSDLQFTDIQLVASHDSSHFTVEAANECGAARIIDRRKEKTSPILKVPAPVHRRGAKDGMGADHEE